MKNPFKIIFKSLVKPFYKENAGTFIFVVAMMFGIVGMVDGAGLLQYHYSLIMAMLNSYTFLLIIFLVWFFYYAKCIAFVSNLIQSQQYNFLYVLNGLEKAKRFYLFLLVTVWLALPVLGYSVLIVVIGCVQHFYWPVLLTICYHLFLCITIARKYTHLLENPYSKSHKAGRPSSITPSSYGFALLRFIFKKQKNVLIGIKVFTCVLLYLIARNNTIEDYDIRFAYLFYGFGVLGNSILIHRVRMFEETYFSFYRGLPIATLKRFFQYGFIYIVVLLPELFTIAFLTPQYLHYTDAINFFLCSYGLLLLMNSISFFSSTGIKEYLKLLLLIYFVQYFFVISGHLDFLYPLLFLTGFLFFIKGYYKFERTINQTIQ